MPFWSKPERNDWSSAQRTSPGAPAPTSPQTQEWNVAILPMKRDEIPTSLGGSSDLLLGAGAEFEGKLTFQGTVRIDARFRGSIETDDVLIVGEHARMDANIVCGTIIVQGEVNGNVHAKTGVELRHTARVRGDIDTPSLALEKGAFLQGAVRMVSREQPSASAKPAAVSGSPAAPTAPAGTGSAPSMLA
jgi:cytoskeletal protein CcmA (bactofilin family)